MIQTFRPSGCIRTPSPYSTKKRAVFSGSLKKALAPFFTHPPSLLAFENLINNNAIDIVIDEGRYMSVSTKKGQELVGEEIVTRSDIDGLMAEMVCHDHVLEEYNRATFPGSSHRVSFLRNFHGDVSGITIRISRDFDMRDIMPESLKKPLGEGKSILLFGPPGSGKTTMLRAVSEYCADHAKKRTVMIDSSGELSHNGLNPPGTMTRVACVKPGSTMSSTMLDIVRNHTPQYIIVDELVTSADAFAAQTCSTRGIGLVASSHAHDLGDLMNNPLFRETLFGGIQRAAVGDEEMKMSGKKFIASRKTDPVFDVAYNCDTQYVYDDLARDIDELL